MGMPLTLHSNHKHLEVRQHARFTYACDGKPSIPVKDDGSQTCSLVINKGDQYVAAIDWKPQRGRAVPLTKVDIGKYCVHCALRKFVDIKIGETHAVVAH